MGSPRHKCQKVLLFPQSIDGVIYKAVERKLTIFFMFLDPALRAEFISFLLVKIYTFEMICMISESFK